MSRTPFTAKKKLKTQRKIFLARITRMTRLLPIISPEIRNLISGDRLSAGGGKKTTAKGFLGTDYADYTVFTL
jgi:hypothetical protein